MPDNYGDSGNWDDLEFSDIVRESYTQHELDIAVIRAIRGAARETVRTDMYVRFGQFPQTWR